MEKAKKILVVLSYTLPGIIFATYILFLCFMPKEIAVHFNLQGNVNRYGSKYEWLIVAFLFYLVPLIMAVIFDKVKMSDKFKIVGLSVAVVVSITFICLTIFFLVKTISTSVSAILYFENRISVILTFVGAAALIAAHILPFVYNKERFKSEIAKKYSYVLYILLGVCGFGIMIGTMLLSNFYSFIIFFAFIILSVLAWFVFKNIVKKKNTAKI